MLNALKLPANRRTAAKTVFVTASLVFAAIPSAIAQIIPDNTLGAETSVVTPNATIQNLPADLIKGGAIRGSSTFHSFPHSRKSRMASISEPMQL